LADEQQNLNPIIAAQPSVSSAVPQRLDSVGPANPIQLSGYVKHHKHPFLSLLKQEFNSPIHAITTNNKDF